MRYLDKDSQKLFKRYLDYEDYNATDAVAIAIAGYCRARDEANKEAEV